MHASNAFAHKSLSSMNQEMGIYQKRKSGHSSAYQKPGSMVHDCQSVMPVIVVESVSVPNMFLLCRSGWNRVGTAAS